jgi:1,2-diacylglycerol 3-alpha-glucosyltransferase
MVGKKMRIPVIHTYHTMYEDYLHYIAKGKVVRPVHVKYFSRLFANHSTGVVCPSERVIEKLESYGVVAPMRIIPTGIEIEKFKRPDLTEEMKQDLRTALGITEKELMVLSLSRISYEKNIQAIIQGLPEVLDVLPNVRMVIVGKGPYKEELEELVTEKGLMEYVQFVGEVPNDEVALYYQAANYFVSASTSETQGLTYTEAMAAGTQMVVEGNDYLNTLISDASFGVTFEKDEDFASCFIEYVKAGIQKNQEILDQKMYEISAEYFGKAIIEFYNDMITFYEENHSENELTETMDKLKTRLRSFKGTSE